MKSDIAWEVSKYGTILDDYEKISEKYYLRLKVYLYNGEHYVEFWCNGIRLLFAQLI